MAKLVALLAALLVAAHVAAAYHTTITTVETIDSDNPSRREGMSQECQHEMQRTSLDKCMDYLMEKQGGGRYGMGGRGGSQEMEMCCDQLRSMRNPECMCEGLEMKMRERTSRPEMMGGMMEMAKNLPRMCRFMDSPCQFRSLAY